MVSVIIVGINQWEEYTVPLINMLYKHEGGNIEIIVVDNASDEPYKQRQEDKWVGGALFIRSEERLCYSAAINAGAKHAAGNWLLSMNNDISCTGPFAAHIEAQKPDAIYARQIIEEAGNRWFGNWIVAIPREVWDEVGGFDERFKVCGFEDADYSMRCLEHGFETRPIDLPFIHHWGKTRWAIPGYAGTRLENISYFASKHGWTPGNNMAVTHD